MPSIIDLNCFKPVRFTFFLVTGICFYWSAMAQNVKPGFGIESNVVAGRIFKHTKKFQGAIPDISGGGELNLVWKTNGRAAWQQRRNYPTIGLGITYTYYDKDLFGQGIGIYPNLELPLLRQSDWEWTLRFGMSLGFVSKQYRPYAPYWDTVNSAMGSRINNFSLLSSDLRYHLNNHWDIQGGISFTHMSAAKFRLPNLGINLLGAHIGFRYFPNTSNPPKIMRKMPELKNRMLFQIRQGIALTTGESAGSAATPVYISSVSLSKRYWAKNKVLIGLDYAYHQYVYDFMRLQALEPGKEHTRAWNAGLYGAHEFLYGRVGLYMQLGVYVRQTLLAKAPIYQRLGMNWYLIQKEKGLIKEMTISTLLKTHFATAELAELGIGIAM